MPLYDFSAHTIDGQRVRGGVLPSANVLVRGAGWLTASIIFSVDTDKGEAVVSFDDAYGNPIADKNNRTKRKTLRGHFVVQWHGDAPVKEEAT